MREIKFRALLDRTKYGSSYKRWFCSDEMGLDKFFALVIAHNLEPQEYTGLKDKNKKEVYEGDIVKAICGCGHSENLPVKSKDGYNGFYLEAEYQHDWDNNQLSLNNYGEVEVIGNIYENKELLEGGK